MIDDYRPPRKTRTWALIACATTGFSIGLAIALLQIGWAGTIIAVPISLIAGIEINNHVYRRWKASKEPHPSPEVPPDDRIP